MRTQSPGNSALKTGSSLYETDLSLRNIALQKANRRLPGAAARRKDGVRVRTPSRSLPRTRVGASVARGSTPVGSTLPEVLRKPLGYGRVGPVAQVFQCIRRFNQFPAG